MEKLLIEIGSEEIPAGYIEPALEGFSSMLLKKLDDARIAHGPAKVMGTPRRLAVMVSDVAVRQESLTMEVVGPPESVGFDPVGKPTMAAVKFAEKVGLPLSEIQIKDTPKGRYLSALKTQAALNTTAILSEALPGIIAAIPFPKVMKWGSLTVTFTRPVHWIAAMLGNQVIPFSYGNVHSGNQSSGHRFMHPGPIVINRPDDYEDALRSAFVHVNLDERRKMVSEDVKRVAREMGGQVLEDPDLVETVKNLVEYAAVIGCQFEEDFLEVPDQVLITAMREHQKYFSVVDNNGRLMNCFVVVNNTRAKDMKLVGSGHERVIRARLSDAKFFYRGDAATPMSDWVDRLKGVLFQAKLGTVYEKVLRVKKLAGVIGEAAAPGTDLKDNAVRAAGLCKADLVSQVVVEFPKLQGIMGRIYARLAGENNEVAAAIEEHYRPTYSGGPLPETPTGAVLAIADKIDSICGCFSVGLIPTGGADPYALRRQGIGILQIMNQKGFSFSLQDLIRQSIALFADKSEKAPGETADAVYDFLKNRISHILEDEGFSKDVIAAVADVSIDHVPHVWERVKALQSLKSQPDFEPLAIAFKRIVNIIKKSDTGDIQAPVDERLFEDKSESALYEAFKTVQTRVQENLAKGSFEQALRDIASLKDKVDAFFEGVMVMSDNMKLRNNRMALLKGIAGMFGLFADFSKIST
jgi:glycyl-tRNA synthetase beta chain